MLFVSIDDNEAAYLTVLLDEVFGRRNGCGSLVWEKKKKPSFLNANLGVVTEFILAYARNRSQSPPFVGGVTTAGKKYPLNNAGNRGRTCSSRRRGVVWLRRRGVRAAGHERGQHRHGAARPAGGPRRATRRLPGLRRVALSQGRLDAVVGAGEALVISKSPFRPNHIKEGGEPKKLKNLLGVASGMATYEDATEESRALFGPAGAFEYPKPERLIATLVGAVTEEGDWVLDSFAGSGTTGAVAHKMGGAG